MAIANSCILYTILGMVHMTLCALDIGDLCPQTSFCTDHRQTVANQKRCCFPCSCHDNCDLVGTCCHDAKKKNPTQPIYSCVNQRTIYNKYLSLTYSSTIRPLFRIVTDCHGDLTNVTNGTISRCRNAHNTEDLVFVTGKTSGISYLNEHCALCNGEDDIIFWDLYMMPDDSGVIVSNTMSYEARDKYIFRTGLVKSVPTSEWAAMVSHCSVEVNGLCNSTGQWVEYNTYLEDRCKTYNAIYYSEERTRFYRNPFCYLCNQPTGVSINTSMCNISDAFSETKFYHRGITTLIITKRKRQKATRAPQICNLGETLDLFSRRCTKLLCPPGTIIVQDDCKPLFEEDSGILIKVLFVTVFEESIAIKQDSNFRPFLGEVRDVLVVKIKIHEPQCDVLRLTLRSTAEGQYFIEALFASSDKCSYLQNLKVIDNVYKTKPIRLFSNNVNGNVSLYGAQYKVQSRRLKKLDEVLFGKIVHVAPAEFNEDMIPCPSILINLTEIEELNIDVGIKEGILDLGVHIENEMHRVCVEDYNKMYALSSSGTCHLFSYVHVLFSSMSLIILEI